VYLNSLSFLLLFLSIPAQSSSVHLLPSVSLAISFLYVFFFFPPLHDPTSPAVHSLTCIFCDGSVDVLPSLVALHDLHKPSFLFSLPSRPLNSNFLSFRSHTPHPLSYGHGLL